MVMLALLLAADAPHPIAALPPRSPITARDLVEIAEIGAPSLSPDGRRIAYRVSRPTIASNATRLDWYVVGVDGGAPTLIANGGVAQYEGSGGLVEPIPVWDPDSRGLRFLARVDGAVGIWHWRDDGSGGGDVERELVDAADILNFTLSDDGSTLRYIVGATREAIASAETHAYDDGVLVDHRLDVMQPIAGGAIEDGKRIMQRLPTPWFERARLLSDAPRETKYMAVAGRNVPLNPQFAARPSVYGRSTTAPNGDRADLAAEGAARSVIVTRTDKQKIVCSVAPCRSPRLAAIDWRPGRDTLLLFERAGGGRETIWLWRVGAARARMLATTDGSIRTSYAPPRCVAARAALVCSASDPIAPPHLVRIDYASGRSAVLADPNGAIGSRIAARATPFQLGADISGILLRPPGTKQPLPLVVHYYHCDGFLKGGTGDEIPMLPLVEQDIAVLCLDQSRAPKSAGMEASYRLALDQIGQSIDRLARAGVIDPRRVGIGGLSFGSEVALWSVRHSNRFAAATLASGQLSSLYYWANALPGRGFADMLRDHWMLGDPDSDTARWQELAPEGNIDAIDTPLLMQLPESEGRFLIPFHTKLKRAGKPAEMVLFADEPHVKYQPVHKRAVYERNLDWLRFWLKGEEDPDLSKADQYARWRSYRAGPSLPAPAP